MTWLLAAILLGAAPENPVFLQLTREGVPVAGRAQARLRAPSMGDGLDAAGQHEVIARLAGPHRRVADLTRKSVVAPFVLKIGKVPVAEGHSPLRTIDLWFVAYGRLEQFTTRKSLRELVESKRSSERSPRSAGLPNEAKVLGEEALQQRGLEAEDTAGRKQGYLAATANLLDRVQLSTTHRVVVTRGQESVLAAGIIDPAFDDDAEYPNQWRPVERDRQGRFHLGDARPYRAAGFYAKATPLEEPAGALFIEYHQVFGEPAGWFGGANLLRSKLPLMVQDGVRKLRRRLAKQGK